MNKQKTIQWIPLFITLILTVLTFIIYNEISALIYIQVIATAFVPAVLPLISFITKKDFPIFINILITIHILLASNLGSAMEFYSRFPSWDLIMHGYFGFVCGVILYTLLLKWNGETLNKFGFLLIIFLSTLGVAAIWEIWEFCTDVILENDAQCVKISLEKGISPIADTMTDIIISILGLAVFYLGLFIDKLLDYKFSKKIYKSLK